VVAVVVMRWQAMVAERGLWAGWAEERADDTYVASR
jgi:hypothetical protein